MFTGMRISEGITLKWENVDLKNRTIYIEEGYIKYYDSKQNSYVRTIMHRLDDSIRKTDSHE